MHAYIRELQQSGFDTIRLQVQFHKKFAIPLFAVIMALISVPFAFIAANRGATAGIAVSFGIAIAYWAVSQLFEQVGNVNQLAGHHRGVGARRRLLAFRSVLPGADANVGEFAIQ